MDNDTPKKTCTKCHKEFPATPEYFHRYNRRGRQELYPQCKACKNGYAKTKAGKAAVKRKTDNWRKTASGKEWLKEKQARKDARYPEKQKARQVIAHAVNRKAILSISECSCTRCGVQAQEYHHWSYEQEHWLDVIPLCRSCHDKLHRMNKVERAKLEARLLTTPKAA